MKKLLFLGSFVASGFFVSSCTLGYVAVEPTYVAYSRPHRPSEVHIWIEGDWVYSQRHRRYVHRNGYWAKPRRDYNYVDGYWHTTPRGKQWKKGYWKKNGRGNNGNGRGKND